MTDPVIPLADPSRLLPGEREAVDDAVARVLASGSYIGGPTVSDFESAFAQYIGVEFGVGVGNGSDGLVLSLLAFDLPPRSSVLVPPNDGGFAASAVQAAGLRPRLADIDSVTGLLTRDTLAEAYSTDVKAVIVTHLHGLAADVAAIAAWCCERGLHLLEDGSQAHGARVDDAMIGSVGDASVFSCYPTKNLGAVGDAGIVLTSDAQMASTVRLLANAGWSPRFHVVESRARTSRLDAVQAAVLLARLPYLDLANEVRRSIVEMYRRAAPECHLLGDISSRFVAHRALVRIDDRDALRVHLARHGVASDIHYPFLVQDMSAIELADEPSTPVAEHQQSRILSVPCFPGMTHDEIARVTAALASWSSHEVTSSM